MKSINRREFIQYSSSALVGASLLSHTSHAMPKEKTIKIKKVSSNFEREPLNPYRFKGSAITESWQTLAYLKTDGDVHKIGQCTQGVLWSDSKVFAGHSETAGNALMYAMTERALQMMKGQLVHQSGEAGG